MQNDNLAGSYESPLPTTLQHNKWILAPINEMLQFEMTIDKNKDLFLQLSTTWVFSWTTGNLHRNSLVWRRRVVFGKKYATVKLISVRNENRFLTILTMISFNLEILRRTFTLAPAPHTHAYDIVIPSASRCSTLLNVMYNNYGT